MAGYAGRPIGALGVHDPLYARAVVLDNGVCRLAVIVADLIALDVDLVERVREGVATALSITPTCVMVHCTHTHGGPYTRSFRAMGHRDDAYVDVLVRKLIGAAAMAATDLRPATLTYGEAPAQIGVNRRRSLPAGPVSLQPNYAGPVAARVQALCIGTPDGRTRAMLFSHACHPTVMGGNNLRFTADWPGAAVTHLQRLMRREDSGWVDDGLAACLVGCCGDINPVHRDTWEAVADAGAQIGGAAHTARWNAHGQLDETLQAGEETLDLPLLPAPPAAESARWIETATERLEAARRADADRGRLMMEQGMLDWAQEIHALSQVAAPPTTRSFTIQRLTLGGVHLLGFPAEMFVRYQLDLVARCRGPMFALGVTNGCHGYLPTSAEYSRGGYEVEEAYKYYGTQMFAPDCEALVRAAAYRLLGLSDADLTSLPV
jgi:hypothetical protein